MTEESPKQARNQLTMTQEQYADGYRCGFGLTMGFLLSRGVPGDAAEEAAQAAWARGWERRDQLRNPKRLQNWVNTIALNVFRNGCRQQKTTELPPEIPIPPRANLRAIDIRRALEKCKPAERDLLHKHYIAGYTSKELAAEGDLTATGVRVRLLRLRRRLRAVISEDQVRGWSASTAASAFGDGPSPAVQASRPFRCDEATQQTRFHTGASEPRQRELPRLPTARRDVQNNVTRPLAGFEGCSRVEYVANRARRRLWREPALALALRVPSRKA